MYLVCPVYMRTVDPGLPVAALFEKVKCNFWELRIGQHILFLLNPLWNFCTQLFKFGLQQICRTAFYRFFIANNLLSKRFVNRHGR